MHTGEPVAAQRERQGGAAVGAPLRRFPVAVLTVEAEEANGADVTGDVGAHSAWVLGSES